MAAESLAPFILNSIPIIVQSADILLYIFSISVFGGIAVKGLHDRPGPAVKYASMAATGLVSMAAGRALGPFVPVPREGIFQLLSLDSVIAALAVSLAFFASFRLLSHGLASEPLKRLESEFSSLRKRLIEEKVLRPISERTAKETAAHAFGGTAGSARLEGDLWVVNVGRNRKQAIVSVSAVDGSITGTAYSKSKVANFFHDPYRLSGLAVMFATTLVVMTFFSGFPSVSRQLEDMGFSQSMLDSLSEQAGKASSSACSEAFSLLSRPVNIAALPLYSDKALKAELEKSAETEITELRLLSKELAVVLGLTDDSRACISAAGEMCGCVDVRTA